MRRWAGLLGGLMLLGATTAVYAAVCGDGTIEPPEQCDDGAANGTPASDCTVACEEVIPALRIPGGGSRIADCQLEGVIDFAAPALDRAGLPARKQRCTDGDPACDRDPAPGTCTIAFWICVAGDDPRIGCAADHVASLEIRRPSERAGGALALVRAELLDKLGAYQPTGPGEVCSGRMLLRVPAGRRSVKIGLITRNASGRPDVDGFKLRCDPSSG